MLKAQSYLLQKYSEIRPLDGKLLLETLDWLFNADKKEHVALLEPGCGPGRVLKVLSQHPKVSLVGIDIIPELVEMAREATKKSSCRIEEGDFLTYDFKNERFDYILFSHYFHHLQEANVSEHINRARKLLKRGGRILLLFEDCPYYSFLMGYPPATPHSHPLTALHETIHRNDVLREIFRRKPLYLPNELAYHVVPLHMAPVLRYSSVRKKVDWTRECQEKRASIFNEASDELRERLAALNGDLDLELTVQPYLFYSGKRLPCTLSVRSKGINRETSSQSGENLTRQTLIDTMQATIQQIFSDDPIAFLSLYPESPTATNRDLYFGGPLPRAELASWYYDSYTSKIAHLVGRTPELSPAYLVAKGFADPGRDPLLNVASAQDLEVSLREVYTNYRVITEAESSVAEYSGLLWQSIQLLNRLLRFTNYRLRGLRYKSLMYGQHSEHGLASLLTVKQPTGFQVVQVERALHWFRKTEKEITEHVRLSGVLEMESGKKFMALFDNSKYPGIHDMKAFLAAKDEQKARFIDEVCRKSAFFDRKKLFHRMASTDPTIACLAFNCFKALVDFGTRKTGSGNYCLCLAIIPIVAFLGGRDISKWKINGQRFVRRPEVDEVISFLNWMNATGLNNPSNNNVGPNLNVAMNLSPVRFAELVTEIIRELESPSSYESLKLTSVEAKTNETGCTIVLHCEGYIESARLERDDARPHGLRTPLYEISDALSKTFLRPNNLTTVPSDSLVEIQINRTNETTAVYISLTKVVEVTP